MSQHDSIARFLPGETQAGDAKDGTVTADEKMLVEELSYIDRMRNRQHGENAAPHVEKLLRGLRKGQPDPTNPYLTGLALSGGGTRSATFALGVLQRLARARLLEKFDYLSTVSGGGYIGSALTWWLSGSRRTRANVDYDQGQEFPFGTRDPSAPDPAPNPILKFLRLNCQYLLPNNGRVNWPGLVIIFRSFILTLFFWSSISFFFISMLLFIGNAPFLNGLPFMLQTVTEQIDFFGIKISVDPHYPPVFMMMIYFSLILFLTFIISAINYSILVRIDRSEISRTKLVAEQTRKKLTPVGKYQATSSISPISDLWRWLQVFFVGILVAGVFFIVIIWLLPLLDPLFGNGYFPNDLVGRLFQLWPGSLVLAVSVIATIALTSGVDELLVGSWRGMVNLLIGFAVIISVDGLCMVAVSEMETTRPHVWIDLGRISGAMQFSAAIGLVVLVNFWTAFLVRAILRVDGMSIIYAGRYVSEKFFNISLPVCIMLTAVGWIPLISSWVSWEVVGIEGIVSFFGGLGASLLAIVPRRYLPQEAHRIEMLLIFGSVFMFFGILLVGYQLALLFQVGSPEERAILAAFCLIGVFTGWFTDINEVSLSLHYYYRDRLIEVFMPDIESVIEGVCGPARRANELRLAEVWDPSAEIGPLHLVNTCAVLSNSANQSRRTRQGDSFVLSPVYCGSNATGWRRTDVFMGGDITLATAMATSGAASNPSAIVGRSGVMLSRLLSMAMTVLNFPLGIWVKNPARSEFAKSKPNMFYPGLAFSIPGVGYTENNSLIKLCDGGRFENTGLYELVRRRCGLIVVSHAGQSLESTYSDLLTTLHRIENDFGASVKFDETIWRNFWSTFLQLKDAKRFDMAPLTERNETIGSQTRNSPTASAYLLATIDYGPRGGGNWPERGLLVVLMPTITDSLAISAKAYKGANPSFPYDEGVLRYFDDERFEAYRELGYRMTDNVLLELDLQKLLFERFDVEEIVSDGSFGWKL